MKTVLAVLLVVLVGVAASAESENRDLLKTLLRQQRDVAGSPRKQAQFGFGPGGFPNVGGQGLIGGGLFGGSGIFGGSGGIFGGGNNNGGSSFDILGTIIRIIQNIIQQVTGDK